MSRLMWILGILLAAAGAALGVMLVVSKASVVQTGMGPDTAAILLVGGILSLGVGSVISLLDAQRRALNELSLIAASPPPEAPIPEFGRKMGEAAVATAAAAAAPAAEASRREEVSDSTRDTIKALEQARQKIEQAFESRPSAAEQPAREPAAEVAEAALDLPPPEDEPVEEEQAAEGQLYVVEERYIRMRPARILSDGTVEAETAEGWMRFENLEHLDEYLEAMEPIKG